MRKRSEVQAAELATAKCQHVLNILLPLGAVTESVRIDRQQSVVASNQSLR